MPLTKEQIEKFKEKLTGTKTEISADLEKLKEGLDFGDDTDSLEEETDETEEFSHYVGVKKLLDERLKAVEEALEKIGKETYGICEKCGGEIESEVLEVVPESRLCKKCKSTA
jgi:RNA polymerase-binding transcription factor DksA